MSFRLSDEPGQWLRVSLVVAAGLLVGLPIGPHAAPPAPQASITVLTPNGGEVWPLGSRQTIRWTSTDITGPVRIRLKRGLLWQTLFDQVPNTGQIDWTVDGSTTTAARIRVLSLDQPTIRDDSDAPFSIVVAPMLTVTAPNGGQQWAVGTEQEIRWTTNLRGGSVHLELSRDGGQNWELLATVAATDSRYLWTVTGPATTQARVRITGQDDPTVSDQSDQPFAIIAQPTLTVTAPNGGQQWIIQSGQIIRWQSLNLTGNVQIELSRDDGQSWETIAADTPDDGQEPWTVTGPATTQARVRISDVLEPGFQDTSREVFTIVPPDQPVITRVEPGRAPTQPGEPWTGVVTAGEPTILHLEGVNLDGVLVTIPVDQQVCDPPTATIIGGDGSFLEVEVMVPASCSVPFLALVVRQGAASTFLLLEVEVPWLRLTSCTPTQVMPGARFVLAIGGEHLEGATVEVGPGLQLASEVTVTEGQITGLLEVAADAGGSPGCGSVGREAARRWRWRW